MDQEKVSAVTTWSMPNTVKELQHFLRFANFYGHFIRNFSTITAPLTALLKKNLKKLTWNPAAEKAFNCLKKTFTTAPVWLKSTHQILVWELFCHRVLDKYPNFIW